MVSLLIVETGLGNDCQAHFSLHFFAAIFVCRSKQCEITKRIARDNYIAMDALRFAFENFGKIGQRRDSECARFEQTNKQTSKSIHSHSAMVTFSKVIQYLHAEAQKKKTGSSERRDTIPWSEIMRKLRVCLLLFSCLFSVFFLFFSLFEGVQR